VTAPVAFEKRTPESKRLAAGGEIDAWCTRCKMDLAHRIGALVSGVPRRVVCMTCGSEHNYRAAKSAASAATPRAAARGGAKSASASRERSPKTLGAKASTLGKRATLAKEDWESQVKSGRPFRRYAATETFEAGDLITHSKFGQGYVVALLGGGKLSIAFADGPRTLVHAGT